MALAVPALFQRHFHGDCVAGGFYTHNVKQAFVATETDGTWGGATAVPGLSSLPGFSAAGESATESVACVSDGRCTAAGIYSTATGTQGFEADETDGNWNTQLISGPQGSGTPVTGLSCGAPKACTVAGGFDTPSGTLPFVLSQDGPFSGTAQLLTGIKGGTEVAAVACAADHCVASGTQDDQPGMERVFVADGTAGTWGKAQLIGGGLKPSELSLVTAAACSAPVSCAIGGFFVEGGLSHAFVADESPVTTSSLTLSAGKVAFGQEQREKFKVKVTARTGGVPSGTVRVRAGSVALCSVALVKGQGSCSVGARKLRPGTYKVTATYGGSATYSGSTSAKKALTVRK